MGTISVMELETGTGQPCPAFGMLAGDIEILETSETGDRDRQRLMVLPFVRVDHGELGADGGKDQRPQLFVFDHLVGCRDLEQADQVDEDIFGLLMNRGQEVGFGVPGQHSEQRDLEFTVHFEAVRRSRSRDEEVGGLFVVLAREGSRGLIQGQPAETMAEEGERPVQ